VFNNLGHLFTYKTGPQIFYQTCFKHDIICIIDDNNLIHNINNYNNLQFWPRSSSCCQQNGDQFMVYFTLRMRDHPWHISIRLVNIYSILSSINIYPLLNTVLKITTFWQNTDKYNPKLNKVSNSIGFHVKQLNCDQFQPNRDIWWCWRVINILDLKF